MRLWDVQTGKQVHCSQGHEGTPLPVAFSPDGRLVEIAERAVQEGSTLIEPARAIPRTLRHAPGTT